MSNPYYMFEQLGFVYESENDTQYIGKCFFCGKPGHFFINKNTLQWDCKVCTKSGGKKSIIAKVNDFSPVMLKDKPLNLLCKNRGLKADTFRGASLGYLPVDSIYTIPTFDIDGHIVGMHVFDPGAGIRALKGFDLHIYNLQNYDAAIDTVWLCEGQWDTLALIEIMGTDKNILGVPGAETFKTPWVDYCRKKRVNILYDNDKAGQQGVEKVIENIQNDATEIYTIKWNDDAPEGYDIRDLYKDNGKDTLQIILNSLHCVKSNKKPKAKKMKLDTVYDTFKKWLYLKDTDIIDVLYGTCIANRFQGDPVWMYLIAPPGGTKTEFIRALKDVSNVVSISTLSQHTLISGWGLNTGNDPSLIPRLDGKMLAIKDYTTVLKMNQTARDEITSVLRDAYDGFCAKPFGNSAVIREYTAKFGIIAGVTPAIEQFTAIHAALGERFLSYKIRLGNSLVERKDCMRRAISNINKEVQMRDELSIVSIGILERDFNGNIPKVSDPINEKIIALSDLLSKIRGTIIRDVYSKEILYKPFSEVATRVSKQLTQLLYGITIFKQHEEVTDDEYRILKQVAKDSMPTMLEEILKYASFTKISFDKKDISKYIHMPQIACSRYLEDLYMLGILKKTDIIEGSGEYKWSLTDDSLQLVKECELYA